MSYEKLSFAPFKDFQHVLEHTLNTVSQLPGFSSRPESHPLAKKFSCLGLQFDGGENEPPHPSIDYRFDINDNQPIKKETGLQLRMHLPRAVCDDLSLFSSVHTTSATRTQQAGERIHVIGTVRKITNQILRFSPASERLVIKQQSDETVHDIIADREGITLAYEIKQRDTINEKLLDNVLGASFVLKLGMQCLSDFLQGGNDHDRLDYS